MARAPSVSRQLVVSVGVPLVLSFGLTVWALDRIFRDSATAALRERLDEELIALVTAAELNEEGRMDVRLLDPESRLSSPSSGHYALVRNQRGRELWRSPSLAEHTLDFGPALGTGRAIFFQTRVPGGGPVAIYSRGLQWDYAPGNSANLVFSVAQDLSGQQAQLLRFRHQLVAWFTGLTVLLLAVLGWLLRRVLRPIHRLEEEIAEVETGKRAQLGGGFPRELSGVARSLNALLRSEQQRIARYRDTLGNLAHSLKTPLAVMRSALASGGDVRAGINSEIDRVAQIVDHQLTRAATSGGTTLGQAAVPVLPIVTELRNTLRKVHAQKDLSIEASISPGAGFVGDRGDIIELLGNLLDNACKWCRSRVHVQVRIDERLPPEQSLQIRVEDDGPGIAPADRARVLARGVRADERAPGHGLGLAMVADAVSVYGGDLAISESALLGGACLDIALPGRVLSGDAC
jgi:two-component system, OmpR family, sensor histidine kinase PhoQ